MADEKSGLQRIIMGAQKRNEEKQKSQSKVKEMIFKMLLQSKIRQLESAQKSKLKEGAERTKNPQKYTPEQQYLRRRLAEENPFAAMMVPEAGQAPITTESGQQAQGISYPKEEVVKSGGLFKPIPVGKDRQRELLSQKVEQMQAQGKRVHPAVLKLLKLQQSSAMQDKPKYDPETGRKIGQKYKAKTINSETKEAMAELASGYSSGKIKTLEDALKIIRKNSTVWRLSGVDLEYVTSRARGILPIKEEKKPGLIEKIKLALLGKTDTSKQQSHDILGKIAGLRSDGQTDEEIAAQLREAGFEPKDYGM